MLVIRNAVVHTYIVEQPTKVELVIYLQYCRDPQARCTANAVSACQADRLAAFRRVREELRIRR